jgi:hypothetical protein
MEAEFPGFRVSRDKLLQTFLNDNSGNSVFDAGKRAIEPLEMIQCGRHRSQESRQWNA